MAAALFALLLAAQPAPTPAPPSAPGPAPRAGAAASGPPQPTDWPFRRFSADDYPAAAIRGGDQGFVAYRLEIGTDGRVSHCTIRQSSGSAPLDAATCRIVSRRSRFTPAQDSAGRYVPDYRDGWVTWRLGREDGEE
jgi:protein TonB